MMAGLKGHEMKLTKDEREALENIDEMLMDFIKSCGYRRVMKNANLLKVLKASNAIGVALDADSKVSKD